jgi:hypothetical protein
MTFFLGELAAFVLYIFFMFCMCGAAFALGEDEVNENKQVKLAVMLMLAFLCGWITTRYVF